MTRKPRLPEAAPGEGEWGVARPLILGIAGGSGSGKTFLARELAAGLGADEVSVLSMDMYFKTEVSDPAEAHGVNFDHPSHLDFRLMMRDLAHLREGNGIWAPFYDFSQMRQTPRTVRVEPRRVVIVEGLFVLAEPIVDLCDVTCFLDVASDERLLGRIMRDLRERGATIEDVVDRYQRYVRASYRIFVEPTKQNADVVVDFTFRRAMFSRMLFHLLSTFLREDGSVDAFVNELRRESYQVGLRPEHGYMPLTTDIFKLAEAYPESRPGRPLASPAVTSFGRRRQES